MRRILKPGGVLVVRVPNTRLQLVKDYLKKILRKEGVMLQADLHLNHFTPPTLRLLLTTAGFDVFREEVGASEDYVFSEGIPLWGKRLYCRLAKIVSVGTSFQMGLTMVQYGKKKANHQG